jgi:uncharacterized protein
MFVAKGNMIYSTRRNTSYSFVASQQLVGSYHQVSVPGGTKNIYLRKVQHNHSIVPIALLNDEHICIMMLIAGYIGAVLMGSSLGLIGGGGSILTVPILVFLFGYNPAMATTYSLFVVGSTSSVGALSHLQLGNINKRAVLLFGLPSVISVFITRKWIVPQIPDHIFNIGSFEITHGIAQLLIFGILMLAAAITMIRDKSKGNTLAPVTSNIPVITKGLLIGVITGLLGAGGGFLIIPALILLLGLDMKKAVGTSLMIITINSLIGFAGSLTAEKLDWKFLITFTLIAMAGIIIGSVLSKKISSEKLKPAFGWFVLLMGGYIIIKELFLH